MLSAALLLVSLALAGSPEKAQALAIKADHLQQSGDPIGAYKASSKALAMDPDNVLALEVQGSILWYAAQASQASSDQQAALMAMARTDLQRVIALQPDSVLASLARSMIGDVPLSLPEPSVVCSPASQTAIDDAEAAFQKHDIDSAKAYYKAATDACPKNPTWLAWYGDAYYAAGDLPGALALYERALSVSPCYWVAHRFAADALAQLGRDDEGFDHAVRAVACNPAYDIGWTFLAGYTRQRGGRFDRPNAPKPTGSIAAVAGADEAALEATAWSAWSQIRYDAGRDKQTALARERDAVRAGIAAIGADGSSADYARPGLAVWPMLARADAKGELDAALFVLLPDAELLAEFPAWRDANPDAASAYVRDAIARLK